MGGGVATLSQITAKLVLRICCPAVGKELKLHFLHILNIIAHNDYYHNVLTEAELCFVSRNEIRRPLIHFSMMYQNIKVSKLNSEKACTCF